MYTQTKAHEGIDRQSIGRVDASKSGWIEVQLKVISNVNTVKAAYRVESTLA